MPIDLEQLENLTLAAGSVRPEPSAAPRPPLQRLREEGVCVLPPQALAELADVPLAALNDLRPLWHDLPADAHLRDGGRYRFRRHGSFILHADRPGLEAVPHRAHWQPTTYNALHGGMERWFAPLHDAMAGSPAFVRLVEGLGRFCFALQPQPRWFVEAHPFRIDTSDGVGRPTPEGAHRDGVNFVVVILVDRHDVRGGETRVFQIAGAHGVRFTLREPWTAMLIDDARVIHESTPIQPAGVQGWRDTLVLTYRADGFLSPPR